MSEQPGFVPAPTAEVLGAVEEVEAIDAGQQHGGQDQGAQGFDPKPAQGLGGREARAALGGRGGGQPEQGEQGQDQGQAAREPDPVHTACVLGGAYNLFPHPQGRVPME